jgi:hypothetical protein
MLSKQKQSWVETLVFPDEGKPDRGLGLVAGLMGGVVGWMAMRLYWHNLAHRIFPPEPEESAEDFGTRWPENVATTERQYHAGEDWNDALARISYSVLTGQEPKMDQQAVLSEVLLFAWGVAMGGTYGGTRTTTRWRDISGGFFYGFRLWLTETVGAPLIGLRRGPGAYSQAQHLKRLSRYWVYSFATTATTRVVYKLLERNS